MHHSVFIHSDTNNVSMLPVPTELLFSSFIRCCSEPSAPAQLPLATERAAASRAGFHPGTKPEARKQHAQPRGNTGDGCQVQTEPRAHTPPYLSLYTRPCSSQPSQNEPLLTKATLTKACEGNWLLLDFDRCSQKQMAMVTNLTFPPLSHYSAYSSHQFT